MSESVASAPVRPRIALYGTFDVLNYGDLLFPHLVANALDPALHDCIAVSPTRAELPWRDTVPTRAVADALRLDARLHLIGGGNIVHVRETPLPAYDNAQFGRAGAYPSLWLGAALIAAQGGARLAWNAPGVPAPIDDPIVGGLRDLVLAASDYVSLRDSASIRFLGAASPQTGAEPAVVPDPALDIARVWPAPALRAHARHAFERHGMDMPSAWLVFHLNDRYWDGEPAQAAHIVSAITRALNATPVLVAIGPCHGDDAFARRVGETMPAGAMVVDDPVGLKEIAALIAYAEGYVGSSLHGLITALSYGRPGVAVARPHMVKFAGFLSQLGMSERFVTRWEDARTAAPRLLQPLTPVEISAITRAQDRIAGHWRRLRGLMTGSPGPAGQQGRARLAQWMADAEAGAGARDWRAFTRVLAGQPASADTGSAAVPCNICGGAGLRPGPVSLPDIVGGGAVCAGCGASARHRAMRVLFDVLRKRGEPKQSCIRFCEDRVLAGGWFADIRDCDATVAAPEQELPIGSADIVACIDMLERAPDAKRLLSAMFRATRADGFLFLALRNVPGYARTLDWGFPRGDRMNEFRKFGADVEEIIHAAVPDARIVVAEPADPVTGVRTRAFLLAHTPRTLSPLDQTDTPLRAIAIPVPTP